MFSTATMDKFSTETNLDNLLLQNFESQERKTEHMNDQCNEIFKSTDSKARISIEPANVLTNEDDQKVVNEIESLCMNCHENGVTRLLLTIIPYFREVILSSFFCSHCNYKSTEVQSASEIQQKGCKYELRLTTTADFARQVIKSETCTIKFIELDIEIPAGRGQLTNVEGLLKTMIEDLELGQPQRKENTPDVWAKIEDLLSKCYQMIDGNSFPFRVEINDPAGNSWIEPDPKDGVGKLLKVEYARTIEQNEILGLKDIEEERHTDSSKKQIFSTFEDNNPIPDEIYSFPLDCPGCAKICETNMKMVDIPHFKQVIIMSTVCDKCGYRSNEVKTGGEIPKRGKKITIFIEKPTDLTRDILKSESCALECPELSLTVNPGTLGGRFTTVEGLLRQIREDLHQNIFSIDDGGDSLLSETLLKWKSFFAQLDEAIEGNRKFTMILTDPLAGSYVQNLCLPDDDPCITTEDYDRTQEEEEDLGLLDMKTEDYLKKEDYQSDSRKIS